jgi:hypothetical protein
MTDVCRGSMWHACVEDVVIVSALFACSAVFRHPYSLELIVSFWFLGKNPNVNLILGFKASGSRTKYILRLAAC